MFLLSFAKIDFNMVFNQGFRLLLTVVSVLCYVLLFLIHMFMLRPMYNICGKAYFSWLTRGFFSNNTEIPLAAIHKEIAAICYLTNVQDAAVLSFGILFGAMLLVELCLLRQRRRLLNLLLMKNSEKKRSDRPQRTQMYLGPGESADKPDAKILRQRLQRKSSTTRFISRLALLLPSTGLSTVQLVCTIITYLLFHLALPILASDVRKANESYLEAIKWRLLIFLFLSFFLFGFYCSMTGINLGMLRAIYNRSRRQEQFKKMNEIAFKEDNAIQAA